MSGRFKELIAKGQAGRLSPSEVEELARLLNAPLLDQLESPPAGFTSRHVFQASDVAIRVRQFDWFAQLGRPLKVDLTMPVEQVGSWAETAASCRDEGWENAQLEARNQLTSWLHQNDRINYQRWNELVAGYKEEIITPLAESVLLPYQMRYGLDNTIVHSVQWDILGALMENIYLSSGHQSYFFLELLRVYEAGHLPCGWRGEWPIGTLFIY